MRILFITLLVIPTFGCMFQHRLLGTRVHRFNAAGINFVHCSILMDQAQPQMAKDAIAVCQDEVQYQSPVPSKAMTK